MAFISKVGQIFNLKTMKLKFSIHYSTEWGQSLHVDIYYYSEGARPQHYLLPMNTEDGELWRLETSVMESRQRPVSSICYAYQVMDTEGRVLRREWDKVPRLYAFDGARDYVFPDAWRDIPLHAQLYSEAIHVAVDKKRHSEVVAMRMPLFRRTVVFRVSAPQLKTGQSVGLCGSHPAMGSWSPSRYLPMRHIGDGDWMLAVNIEGMPMPLEYKFVVVDDGTKQLLAWEEGENRSTGDVEMRDGAVLVLYGGALRLREMEWKAAGLAVPVFAMRSEHSCGVGDFGDLKRMAQWAAKVGMKVLQILPVADTTTMHSWTDSHPYNIISAFALHPHYIDLEQLGPLDDEERMVAFNRQRRELNALEYSDYMAVDRVKNAYVDEFFAKKGQQTVSSKEYADFVEKNQFWLLPYCAFCILRDINRTARFSDWGEYAVYDEAKVRAFLQQHAQERDKIAFMQFHLHMQLKNAADVAHSLGVAIMGDLPVGIYRDSVETWCHPDFFQLDAQVGTPPDNESITGQNWGFPPYRWNTGDGLLADADSGLVKWFRRRMRHQEQYFDAIRIDHAVGYFRIWEIPDDAVLANMGHFAPALPLSEEEITRYGMTFRRELHTRPFINERILQRFFGIHAKYVKDNFLIKMNYGLFALREEYDSQVKVRNHFGDLADENSLWIRDGLYRLIANVLFMEDRHSPGMYHPRFMVYNEPVYEILSAEEKDAFMRLYNNYYYERHNDFWAYAAERKLSAILAETRMLVVAEDLGMLPACVHEVLEHLRILSTEIQTMPKQPGVEFTHLEVNPYQSVCTFSNHDMAPMRLWWEENIGRTQRYYVTVMQKRGRAPQQLPPHLAELIVARMMFSPSMLCILTVQDWLAMDSELRGKNVAEERINSPYDVYNQWKYRMTASVEQLDAAAQFNNKLRTMVAHSKRLDKNYGLHL